MRLRSQQSQKAESSKEPPWNGVILNMDVGMGKTAITLIDAKYHGLNVLFVCQPNVVSHIQREIAKHLGEGVSVFVANSWPCFKNDGIMADITIMTYYVIARLDRAEVAKFNYRFTTCIIDEVHAAGKKKNVRETLLSLLCADFFIGLTAEKRFSVLPLLPIVHSSPCFDKCYTFRQPPHFEFQKIAIEMTQKTRVVYEKLKADVVSSSMGSFAKQKLLQKSWEALSLDKVPTILEQLCKIPTGYKVVVVSQFNSTLQSIAIQLSKSKYLLLNSKVKTQKQRRDMLECFEYEENCTFLLASFEIVYIGLNLGFVDYLFLADFPYDPSDKFQMFGRLRRLGQRPRNLRTQQIVEVVVNKSSDSVLFNCA